MFDPRLWMVSIKINEIYRERLERMGEDMANPKQKLSASGAKKESQIQKEILEWMHTPEIKEVCFVFRQQSVGVFDPIVGKYRFNHGLGRMRGVSDILGIVGTQGLESGLLTGLGRFLAIEVKSTYGRLTAEQSQFLMQVNNRGGIGIVARCVEDVQQAFKREGLIL